MFGGALFSEFNRICSSNLLHNFDTVAEFSPILFVDLHYLSLLSFENNNLG